MPPAPVQPVPIPYAVFCTAGFAAGSGLTARLSVESTVSDKPEIVEVVPDAEPPCVARLPASSTVTEKVDVPGAPAVPLQVVFATVDGAVAAQVSPAPARPESVKRYASAGSTEGKPPVATYVSGKHAPPPPEHPEPVPYARPCTAAGGVALTPSD